MRAGPGARQAAIKADLLAALDAAAPGQAPELAAARDCLAQDELGQTRDFLHDWLAHGGGRLPARGLVALARADMALRLTEPG